MSNHESGIAASDAGDGQFTRREVVIGAAVAPVFLGAAPGGAAAQPAVGASSGPASVQTRMVVSGTPHALSLDPRSSLLDVLREQLALTGAKKGCDHGQCGACTVHLDGRRVASCLTPAVQVDGREVLTIEGLSGANGELHPMQQAFIDHDALQCGYCTPGQIMAAVACVFEGHATSPEQIREYMSGNICRCGAYVGIVAAIQDAAPKIRGA
jgi:xanthine dehydrogenase YagT iron-sulfur-binding subunit